MKAHRAPEVQGRSTAPRGHASRWSRATLGYQSVERGASSSGRANPRPVAIGDHQTLALLDAPQ